MDFLGATAWESRFNLYTFGVPTNQKANFGSSSPVAPLLDIKVAHGLNADGRYKMEMTIPKDKENMKMKRSNLVT